MNFYGFTSSFSQSKIYTFESSLSFLAAHESEDVTYTTSIVLENPLNYVYANSDSFINFIFFTTTTKDRTTGPDILVPADLLHTKKKQYLQNFKQIA